LNLLSRGRLRLFALFLLIWGGAVVGRLVQLQIARNGEYRARAQRQQERRIEVSPRRGTILDREGRELAVSVEAFSVFAIPEEVRRPRQAARFLAPVLHVPEGTLLSRLTQPKGFVWLARKAVDHVAADRIRVVKLSGVHLVTEAKRFYPKGPHAASVLGYVGTDDRGLAGLEYLYDETVRGKPGEIVVLKDARRSTYGEAEAAGVKPPREGATLTLSLDSGLQFAAERELAAGVEAAGAKSGALVLLDPATGDILAMATVPGFDPNRFGGFSAEERRNRAVADAHEPGSTFKIVTGALALESSVVTLDEVIETGEGNIRVANTIISEHDNRRFGALTLAGVFEHSSNVGIIRVGLRLGARKLFDGASALGVGRATGVDLPGENPGIFRPLSRWSGLSTASISMGQEVALTPLQLARIAAAVANGGLLVTPRLVTRVEHSGGSAQEIPRKTPVRVLSEETARKIRHILVGAVERGTGTRAAVPGFVVGGKTGTAQKAGPGGYEQGRYVSSFVGLAPAEDPRLVCAVVIEEPRGKYYASEIAAPVFSRVVSQSLAILRVAPAEQRLPSTVLASVSPSSDFSYPAGVVPAAFRRRAADSPQLPSDPPAGGTPDARGLSAREALALFARFGVSARLLGTGFVVAQTPSAGAPIRPGQTHRLYLAQSVTAALPAGGRRMEETGPPLPAP